MQNEISNFREGDDSQEVWVQVFVTSIELELEGARQFKNERDSTLSHMTQKQREVFGTPLRVIELELHAGTN
jgi:hypothetical protein